MFHAKLFYLSEHVTFLSSSSVKFEIFTVIYTAYNVSHFIGMSVTHDLSPTRQKKRMMKFCFVIAELHTKVNSSFASLRLAIDPHRLQSSYLSLTIVSAT
jgi:hypothetical protein